MNSSKLVKTRLEVALEVELRVSLALKDSMISLEEVLDKAGLASRTLSVIYSKSLKNSLGKVDHKDKAEDLVEDNSKRRAKTLL